MRHGKFRQYLGDGVYADFDGLHLVLTTENGIGEQNTIYMDDVVVDSFSNYLKKLPRKISEFKTAQSLGESYDHDY